MDDANRGTIGNNKTRAKYLAQTRKGRKIGEPIPLDIEITDLSDRSQHLSLPQQQMLEQHRHGTFRSIATISSLSGRST
jgi:hypothetical protein